MGKKTASDEVSAMHMPIKRSAASRPRSAFTLVELLVVIGIIVLLLGILIPVVSKVRQSARNASAQAQISSLAGAIERYFQDHKAYPGPIANAMVANNSPPLVDQVIDFASGSTLNANITMSENLVLGLLGGLRREDAATIVFDWNVVGRGPLSLTSANPKRFDPYLDAAPRTLSWNDAQPTGAPDAPGAETGIFADDTTPSRKGVGAAGIDSPIPEFVDPYPEPMPVLYLRANRGASGIVSNVAGGVGAGSPPSQYQYDISQIINYTGPGPNNEYIGVGKDIGLGDYKNYTGPNSAQKLGHGLSYLTAADQDAVMDKADPKYQYPLCIVPYLRNPAVAPTNTSSGAQINATGTPREKDRYILISAGPDRVYGTYDDITNFGSVAP